MLRHKLSREHLSAISGITTKGRIYIQTQENAFKGQDVVNFLKHLLKHILGKILVVWDGASIHRCNAIKTFLAEGASERIWLESLPPYAPDLNPDEGVWQYLKCGCLKNICCPGLKELKKEFQKGVSKLRSRPHIIKGCFNRMKYF